MNDGKVTKTDCGANGWMSGVNIGQRAETVAYNPTLLASWWIRQKVGSEAAGVVEKSIPPATDSFKSDVPTGGYGKWMDRGQVMTSIFLHEFAHALPYLAGGPKAAYEDQAHKEVVTPIQRLGEVLLLDLPGFRNPTPYPVETAFGIEGDPLGEEHDLLAAERDGYLYAMPEDEAA